jgi:hypothetical protein|tara:strand:- start:2949 stop:3500 length:552 start_codon:yes stop_codon:yes gene_type:complete
LKVGDAVDLTDGALVDVGEFSVRMIGQVGGGEVGSKGAAGLVAEVGRIPMEGAGVEEDEVSGVEDYAAWLIIRHDGDGAHFRGEVDEGNPGGEHFGGAAGEPAALLSVPVVIDFARRTRLFVEELVVPEADLFEREGFVDEGCEATVAEKGFKLSAEEGGVGVFAGACFAGARVGPLKIRGAV